MKSISVVPNEQPTVRRRFLIETEHAIRGISRSLMGKGELNKINGGARWPRIFLIQCRGLRDSLFDDFRWHVAREVR